MKGATVDLQNNNGDTALIFAAINGHTDTIKALIEKDADVDLRNDYDGNTALILAAQNGHTDIVKALIENGANVNLPNNNGYTPLMIALVKGHTDIATKILEKHANVNLQNNNGDTALIFAAENDHTDAVKALIEKGADVNFSNKDNNTALILAAQNGHTDIVRAIVEHEECNIESYLSVDNNILKKLENQIAAIFYPNTPANTENIKNIKNIYKILIDNVPKPKNIEDFKKTIHCFFLSSNDELIEKNNKLIEFYEEFKLDDQLLIDEYIKTEILPKVQKQSISIVMDLLYVNMMHKMKSANQNEQLSFIFSADEAALINSHYQIYAQDFPNEEDAKFILESIKNGCIDFDNVQFSEEINKGQRNVNIFYKDDSFNEHFIQNLINLTEKNRATKDFKTEALEIFEKSKQKLKYKKLLRAFEENVNNVIKDQDQLAILKELFGQDNINFKEITLDKLKKQIQQKFDAMDELDVEEEKKDRIVTKKLDLNFNRKKANKIIKKMHKRELRDSKDKKRQIKLKDPNIGPNANNEEVLLSNPLTNDRSKSATRQSKYKNVFNISGNHIGDMTMSTRPKSVARKINKNKKTVAKGHSNVCNLSGTVREESKRPSSTYHKSLKRKLNKSHLKLKPIEETKQSPLNNIDPAFSSNAPQMQSRSTTKRSGSNIKIRKKKKNKIIRKNNISNGSDIYKSSM